MTYPDLFAYWASDRALKFTCQARKSTILGLTDVILSGNYHNDRCTVHKCYHVTLTCK